MGRFVVRRLTQGAATLLLATLLFHASVTLLPGDPIRAIWGPTQPPADVLAEIRSHYRLDQPYVVQYSTWLGDLVRGDLGTSYPRQARGASASREGPPITSLLTAAAPVSARLLVAALAIQMVVGVAVGVVSVQTRRRRLGRQDGSSPVNGIANAAAGLSYSMGIVAVATPAIVLAYVGQLVFATKLGWLPIRGVSQGWISYLLPTIAVGTAATGYIVLLTQRELAQTLRKRFVAAATARGVSDRRVIAVHALRAAFVPILTLAAANLGLLVASQIVVEGVFELPGLGGLVFDAIRWQDRALLVPTVTIITAAVILANLLADLLSAVINPTLQETVERSR